MIILAFSRVSHVLQSQEARTPMPQGSAPAPTAAADTTGVRHTGDDTARTEPTPDRFKQALHVSQERLSRTDASYQAAYRSPSINVTPETPADVETFRSAVSAPTPAGIHIAVISVFLTFLCRCTLRSDSTLRSGTEAV